MNKGDIFNLATEHDINDLHKNIEYLSGEKANKDDLKEHIDHNAQSTSGAHGLRVQRGKLEYRNEDGEWEIISGGDSPAFSDIENIDIQPGNAKVSIKWTDPNDVVFQGVTLTKWQGTKLIRKEGSYPVNENDGVLVTTNGVRNQYKDKAYVDSGLTNDKTYYYLLVPFSDDNQHTISENNRFAAKPVSQRIHGVEVDETNLNPKTAVTYISSSVGMTPAKGSNLGSWEEWLKSISSRVLLKNGVEQYQVDYNDPRKKVGGGSATLTGADGDVMTKISHMYRKFTKTSKGYKLELSDKPFSGAVSYTKTLESGYNQFNNPIMILLQDLYLIVYKDRNSQTALGRGYVDMTSDDPFKNTGGTNGKGFMFGETTGKQQMCFMGIEDMWGNKFQWVDGLVSDDSYNILTGTKSFNDSGSGYTKHNTGITENLYGYAKTVQGGECGYVLADKSGSSSTGYCDYGDLDSGMVARFGGVRSSGSDAGVFYVGLYYSASNSDSNCGARLCFKNTDAVYIGNYLGYLDDTKLRSISGKEPTGNKKIGEFRTYAKNNN